MAIPIAPGIYTTIVDESQYAQVQGGTTAFFPILSPSGIDNTLIAVTSQSQLINSFGSPNLKLYGQSLYNAFNFLSESANAYVLRPLPTVEDTANAITNGNVVPSTPVYPWTDKPATFAGTVYGFFTTQNLNIAQTKFNSSLVQGTQVFTSLTVSVSGIETIASFQYTVGANQLQVYKNGQPLVQGTQWQEVGSYGSLSNQILFLTNIASTDTVAVFLVNRAYLSSVSGSLANPYNIYLPQALQPSYYSPNNVLATTNLFTGTFVNSPSSFTAPASGAAVITTLGNYVYLPFAFTPGQNQLTVSLNNGTSNISLVLNSGYTELETGMGIEILSAVEPGYTITVSKFGVDALVRYTAFTFDPYSNKSVNHNLRSIAITNHNLPSTYISTLPYNTEWSYNPTEFSSTAVTNPTFTPLFVVTGLGRGQAYNNIQVTLTPVANNSPLYTLTVYTVNTQFNLVNAVETFTVSFNPQNMGSTSSTFIEDVVNNNSNYIQVWTNIPVLESLATVFDPVADCYYYNTSTQSFQTTPYIAQTNGQLPTVLDRILALFATINPSTNGVAANQQLVLTGGHEGCFWSSTGTTLNQAVVDNILINTLEGTYDPAVLDSSLNNISLMYDANFDAPVKQALITAAQIRGDTFVTLDLGYATNTTNAVSLRNSTYNYNSYIAALYAPFSTVYSNFEGKNINVAPSYHMSYITPYSDSVGQIWFADAGINRGTADGIINLAFSANAGDMNLLYTNQINPIVYRNQTFLVFGQLTTQRVASALQDKNIVRLILFLNKTISHALFAFLFEQNDSITWGQAANVVKGILAQVAALRGLYSYGVTASATAYELSSKTFHVTVTIQPERTTEKILLQFVVT